MRGSLERKVRAAGGTFAEVWRGVAGEGDDL